MDDRRVQQRYNVMAHIRARRGRVNYIMDVANISLSGVFVATDAAEELSWIREGQNVEIDLFTTEDLDNVRVSGRIARIVNDPGASVRGFGVEFGALEPEMWQRLTELVDQAKIMSLAPPPLPGQGDE